MQPPSTFLNYWHRHFCLWPGVLRLVAFKAALEVFEDVDMRQLRVKSNALCDLFTALVEQRCAGNGRELLTPRRVGLLGDPGA
jgi:kynureninase